MKNITITKTADPTSFHTDDIVLESDQYEITVAKIATAENWCIMAEGFQIHIDGSIAKEIAEIHNAIHNVVTETNITTQTNKKHKWQKHPYDKLKIGESFIIEGKPAIDTSSMTQLAQKSTGYKFKSRSIDKPCMGTKITRIA